MPSMMGPGSGSSRELTPVEPFDGNSFVKRSSMDKQEKRPMSALNMAKVAQGGMHI